MKHRYHQLTKWMKGHKRYYFLGLFILFTLQYFRTLPPLFVQHIIDSIFDDKASNLPIIIQNLIAADGVQLQLLYVAIFSVLFTLFRVIFFFLHRVLIAFFAENVSYNMRNKLYDHLQNLSFSYHSNAETGDLIQRTTTDVDTYRMFIGEQLVEVVRMTFLMVFTIFQMSRMHVPMTLISIIVAPIIFVIASVYFVYVKKVFKRVEEAEGTMTTTLQESVTGIRVVKAFGNERFEIDRFDEKSHVFRKESYTLIRLMAWFWGGTDFLIFGQYLLTASFGIYFVVMGQLGAGQFIAFLSLLGLIVWPIRQLGRIIGDFGKTIVSLDRLDEIVLTPTEHDQDRGEHPEIKGNITFKSVGFQFEDDAKPLLKNISFDVEAGQTVAIVGKTGSGKSTLLNLMVRLLDHQEGQILFDGIAIEDINKKWLRKHVGIILQEPFLYSKTVFENIAIMNQKAAKDTIFSAARVASVHDDILNFEAGYDTVVGERGVTLSGGQKQRVAIARMLLDNKPVLIFDDSLSAVDTETDIQIRRALMNQWKNTTVFIITHRIATAMEADKIIVLDKGEIIETGNHESLLRENGVYAQLWDIQTSIVYDFKTRKEGSE